MSILQISDLPKKNEASKDDILMIEQKQEDNTYKTKSVTLESVGNYLKGIVGNGTDGTDINSDVIDVATYSVIPFNCSDIKGVDNAITLPSDIILIGHKNLLDTLYIKYPENGNFIKINANFAPQYTSSQYYLNLPKSTKFYSTYTSTTLMYLKINRNVFSNKTENINSIHFDYEDGVTKEFKSDESESENTPGVFWYTKLVTSYDSVSGSSSSKDLLQIYVKNTTDKTVYCQISNGSTITRTQCFEYQQKGNWKMYGDYYKQEGMYFPKKVQANISKKSLTKSYISPGKEGYIGQVRANFSSSIINTTNFKNYYSEALDGIGFDFKFPNDTLNLTFFSINQLKDL